ncbi:MAG: helix-turn-helix transcriptional regulator [Clostridia bacterium]|nr:helix-turn-helix transcriptional regulator [Clostridia bacterium]
MLTPLGKYLRKLRIDKGEILKDMSDKLEVTVSFLSAVENGKKKMPSEWNQKICDLYKLDDIQKKDFSEAIATSEEKIEMNLKELSFGKDFAVAFARELPKMNEKQINSIAKKFEEILSKR